MRHSFVKDIRNIVIKVGTSVLTTDGRFDPRVIDALAGQISAFLKKGMRVSVVSSGAIGAGMTILKMRERPKSMEGLQGAAAVGQRYLMQCYENAFSRHGFSTAQILLTWDDLAERKRFLNAKRTLREIQRWGVVPVINENDTVATDEIRFGDNDRLSALLSILVEADVLVILSDTDGLYANGDRTKRKNRIQIVGPGERSIFTHVKDRKTHFTTGGMSAKLRSIRISTGAGIPAFLADGRRARVLERIFGGDDIGTFFAPDPKKGRSEWIDHFIRHIKR